MADITRTDAAPNLAETLAREMKEPRVLFDHGDDNRWAVALPPGWTHVIVDDEKMLSAPRRKTARVTCDDADSFIAYIARHGSDLACTLWCYADYAVGKVGFTAILNDTGEADHASGWRDHIATFNPTPSEEWKRWTEKNTVAQHQAEFATFIEDNLKDIVSADSLPSGAQMLEMALAFEAHQDMRFKSAIRLQSGGIHMAFTQNDDDQTIAKMRMFERFAIRIPAFWGAEAHQIEARLRYRVRDGKLAMWYELIRPDMTLESSTMRLIDKINGESNMPFFFGNPFA